MTARPEVPGSTRIAPAAADSTTQNLVQRITATADDKVLTLLRVALGVVMLPHGAQKVLGWFGGGGFGGTMGFMTEQLGIPAIFAVLAIAAESVGAIGLITGTLTRVAALGILGVMTVAALTVHLPNGFFMNWTGAQAGEGFEYHILAGIIAVALIVRGGGAWSVDRVVSRA